MLDRFFRLRDHGTTALTEVVGGATTFAAMAYIIVVNPAILQAIGLPTGPSTVATIVVAAAGSILMGLVANRPFAVAPYMGENAFLAFGLAGLTVGGVAVTWQQRLGAVFVSGAAFLLLTLVGARGRLAAAISPSLKHGFAVGIGLFVAFLGLYQTGIVASPVDGMTVPADGVIGRPPVPVKLGNLRDPRVLLAVGGFVLTACLLARRVRGAVLFGMTATAAIGAALGHGAEFKGVFALPFTGDYTLAPVAGQLDVRGVLRPAFLPVLLTLFLMSFLDTLGTLSGVGAAGGMLDENGNLPRAERPMLVDAVANMGAALVGTSTTGAYIESATGVREGARTGLAAVVTGLLFAAALFAIPLAEPLQQLTYVYGPALIAVGVVMLGSAARVAWDDPTEAVPAFASVVMIAFTFNIANGLTAGLLLHPVLKLAAGRPREITVGSAALALASLAYYAFGLPH